MLISDDVDELQRARFLATQARDQAKHYQHSYVGHYRMSNILVGVGRAQLEVLDDRVEAKRAVFNRYVKALGDIDSVHFMPELEDAYSNRWLTALTLDSEKVRITLYELIDKLEARLVSKRLHMQPLFEGCTFYPHAEDDVVSELLFAEGICLPSGSNMTVEQQERVIEVLKKALIRHYIYYGDICFERET